MRVALDMKLSLLGDGAASAWIHLTRDGKWKGHAAGEFEFGRDTYAQIISNFNRQHNPVPLTYGHPKKGTGSPSEVKAGGWIRDLSVRDSGLWAFAEFTEEAADMVRKGELKFSSMVVLFDSIDRETAKGVGAELLECALTNVPFIDHQEPLQLDREIMATKKRALSAEPEVTAADIKVAALADPTESTIESPSAEGAEAVDRDIVKLVTTTLGMDGPAALAWLQEHADLLKVGEKAPAKEDMMKKEDEAPPMAADNTAAVEDVKAISLARMGAMAKQLEDKEERIAKLEREVTDFRAREMERVVEEALAGGIVLPKDKEFCLKLGRSNPELLAEYLKRDAVVPQGQKVSKQEPTQRAPIELSDDDPDVIAFERGLAHRGGNYKELAKRAAMEFKAKQAAERAAGMGA